MARRVPKLLVPLMVVLTAIAFAMWAMLPSSASEIAPPADGPGQEVTSPAPAPSFTTVRPPKPKPGTTYDPGPRDCASCMGPGVD